MGASAEYLLQSQCDGTATSIRTHLAAHTLPPASCCLHQDPRCKSVTGMSALVQIQSVMMRDLKSCSSARPAPAADLGRLTIDPAIAEAATKMVEKVFDSWSQVLLPPTANLWAWLDPNSKFVTLLPKSLLRQASCSRSLPTNAHMFGRHLHPTFS